MANGSAPSRTRQWPQAGTSVDACFVLHLHPGSSIDGHAVGHRHATPTEAPNAFDGHTSATGDLAERSELTRGLSRRHVLSLPSLSGYEDRMIPFGEGDCRR
ncbi:hypothetical protein [Streptomyces sp. NPDC020965]|uniref:hypothetical protein n=1 Tax=Streptomyces sp. NPDC020965 TaxID=3365105 RepID=UPI0037A55A05